MDSLIERVIKDLGDEVLKIIPHHLDKRKAKLRVACSDWGLS